MHHGDALGAQVLGQESRINRRLHIVAGVDAEEVLVPALAEALLGCRRRDDDDGHIFVVLHRGQCLPAVEVPDHAQDLLALLERLFDLGDLRDGHVAVGFII